MQLFLGGILLAGFLIIAGGFNISLSAGPTISTLNTEALLTVSTRGRDVIMTLNRKKWVFRDAII